MPDLMVAFLGWNSNFEKKVRGALIFSIFLFMHIYLIFSVKLILMEEVIANSLIANRGVIVIVTIEIVGNFLI